MRPADPQRRKGEELSDHSITEEPYFFEPQPGDLERALRNVEAEGMPPTPSRFQRRFRWGYTRASAVLDAIKAEGLALTTAGPSGRASGCLPASQGNQPLDPTRFTAGRIACPQDLNHKPDGAYCLHDIAESRFGDYCRTCGQIFS